MRLSIRNLSATTTNEELEGIFSVYGEVVSVKLTIDPESGISRGFGFIEMANDHEAQQAIQGLNGTEVRGRSLSVRAAPSAPPVRRDQW